MVDEEGGVALDPICGRPVIQDESEELEYKRKRYFFCSGSCKARFERRAERIHVSELAKLGGLLSERKTLWGLA